LFVDSVQVPVLTHQTALSQPIRDSLDITLYIAEQYPELIPQSHRDEISHLLQDLHSINYFSLSFSGEPEVASSIMRDPIMQILERPDISERYRDALQYKLMM
jgi:glutathione S-transferase